MRAKFIYESISDVFKPKSNEDILANLNNMDKNQLKSLLFNSAAKGIVNNIKYLINAGVDINVVNTEGLTPLHVAAWCGQLNVVEELLKAGADVNTKDFFGGTPLLFVSEKHKDIKDLLLKYGAKE